jgi:hypothetical protein
MALAVFDKQDSDQLTVEEIDQVINRYPYFAVLHYLKAGKLMIEQAPDANSYAAKAALFFPNPHWLDLQLRHEEVIPAEHTEALAALMITPNDAALIASHEELSQPDAGNQQDEDVEYDSRRVYEENEANDTGDYHEERIVHPDEGVASEGLQIDGAASQQWSQEEVAQAHTGLQISLNDVIHGEASPTGDFLHTENKNGDASADIISREPTPDGRSPLDTTWQPLGAAGSVGDAAGAPVPEGIGETEAIIPIEPLYSIDYFASQGIKLSLEDVPGDQLAVKLRSFTEWLKSMKRIQPEKMDRQLDQETEKQIRQTAEHSNENMDLYTESLAEVYRKQGLDDKAVEVFQKLSLLDPAKSAYFAARIREIKEI